MVLHFIDPILYKMSGKADLQGWCFCFCFCVCCCCCCCCCWCWCWCCFLLLLLLTDANADGLGFNLFWLGEIRWRGASTMNLHAKVEDQSCQQLPITKSLDRFWWWTWVADSLWNGPKSVSKKWKTLKDGDRHWTSGFSPFDSWKTHGPI